MLRRRNTVNIPAEFYCPIKLNVMVDPVTLPCGHNFECDLIVPWLDLYNTCPLDRSQQDTYRHNRTLRRRIVCFFDAHPEFSAERPEGIRRTFWLVDKIKDLSKCLWPVQILRPRPEAYPEDFITRGQYVYMH